MSEHPAIATYQEWLGWHMPGTIKDHVKANVSASLMAQHADLNDVVTSVHYHRGLGVFLFASAPILPKAKDGET